MYSLKKFFLILFFSFLGIIPSFAQTGVSTVSGSVISIERSARTISIEYADEANNPQNISLVLSPDIELFGLNTIDELYPGDNVTVDYVLDEQNILTAVYLYKFPPP